MRGRIVYNRTGQTYEIEGREVTAAEFFRAFPAKPIGVPMVGGNTPACWPQVSTALGVHPRQAQEATDDAKKKGVPTEFQRDGRAIFTDRTHRKRYCQAYGYRDNNAGYGDAGFGDFKGEMPDQPRPDIHPDL